MPNTLIISFLPREGSNTAKLVKTFKDAAGGKTKIVERQLDEQSVPLMNKEAMAGWWSPGAVNEVEKVSAELINELKAADKVIIATPMFNWSTPAPVKAWLDLVIRGGQTFESTSDGLKGLLNGQEVGLLVTTGMTELSGNGDHLTPVIKTAFGFMGGGEVTTIGASELMIINEDEAKTRMDTAIKAAEALAHSWFK